MELEEKKKPTPTNDKLKALYSAASESFNLGSYEDFETKLQDSSKRKSFYDAANKKFNLGDYESFEQKVLVKKKDEQLQGRTAPISSPSDSLDTDTLSPTEEKKDYSKQMAQVERQPMLDELTLGIDDTIESYKDFTKTTEQDVQGVNQSIEGMKAGEQSIYKKFKDYIYGTPNMAGGFPNPFFNLAKTGNIEERTAIAKEISSNQNIPLKDVQSSDIDSVFYPRKKKEMFDAIKEAKTEEFIEALPDGQKEKMEEYFGIQESKARKKTMGIMLENEKLFSEFQLAEQSLKDIKQNHDPAKTYSKEYYENSKNTLEARNALFNKYQENLVKLNESSDELMDVEKEVDLFKRNYGKLYNLSQRILLGSAEMGLNIENALDKINFGFTTPMAEMMPEIRENFVNQLREGISEGRDDLRKTQSLEGIQSTEDVVEFMLDLTGDQLPNTVLMPTTGGASLGIMGASAFGAKFYQLEQEEKQSGGNVSYSNLQKYGSALVSGIAEPLSERISLGQIKYAKRVFKGATQNQLKEGTLSYLKNKVFSGKNLSKYALDTVEEGGSESLATLAENISQNVFEGKDTFVLDNVGDSFVKGAIMSGVIYKAPTLLPIFTKPFIKKDVNQKIGKSFDDITKIDNELANSEISDTARQVLTSKKEEIIATMESDLSSSIEKIGDMEEATIAELVGIEKQKFDLRKKAKDISEDFELGDKARKSILTNISLQISSLDIQKEAIIEEAGKSEFEKLDTETKQSYVDTAGKEIEQEFKDKNEENYTISEEQINERAEQLYEAEKTAKEETKPEVENVTPTSEVEQENIKDAKIDIKNGTIDDLEKRQFEIEESRDENDRKEFIAIDNELESREWRSVLNSPLEKVSETIDALIQKDKDMPNGFGSYIERQDARETKKVADKYQGKVSRAEAKKDFKNAFFGNPSTWYADGLKLKESVRAFIEIGGTFKNLLTSVQKEFEYDGFTEQDAASIINSKLQEIAKVNETTQSQDTTPNGNVQPRIETSSQQREDSAVQPPVDNRTSETTIKKVNPSNVKGEFDVEIDSDGKVTKIVNAKGREIPKFIESTSKTGKKYIKKNANYQVIEADAIGVKTENEINEESKQQFNEALDASTPNDAYTLARDYIVRGGNFNLESVKKETGLSSKEVQWTTKSNGKFQGPENAPSIERVAESIVESSDQDLDVQDVRNQLIQIISSNESTQELKKQIVDEFQNEKENQNNQELETYIGALSPKEFAIFDSIKSEEDYISELTDEEAVEYFTQEYENKRTRTEQEIESVEQSGEAESQSVQEPQRESKEQKEVLAQQGLFGKKSKRNPSLNEDGPVERLDETKKKHNRFWNKTIRTNAGTTQNVANAIRSQINMKSEIMDVLEGEARVIEKIEKNIRKRFPRKSNQILKEINNFMSGDKDAKIDFVYDSNGNATKKRLLSIDQILSLEHARNRIDKLSFKLINKIKNDIAEKQDRVNDPNTSALVKNTLNKSIEAANQLLETIEGNIGQYMNRSYQAFTDDKYIDALMAEETNKSGKKKIQNAVDYLVKEDGLSEEDARTTVYEYLDGMRPHHTLMDALIKGKAQTPFLKKRKDIPEVFRELLGEIKEPSYNYVSTVYKMSTFLANIEYQNRLRNALDDSGLISETAKEGYTKLVPDTEGWQILGDIYVPTETKDSIEDLQPLGFVQDKAYRTMIKIAGYTKLGKTVLSPTTAVRNVISGVFLGLNAGFLFGSNPKLAAESISMAWGGTKTKAKMRDEISKLIKLGILNDGARSKEITGILNDFSKELSRINNKSLAGKVFDLTKRFYALGDDMYKTYAFYTYVERYMKSGYNREDAESKSAERVRKTFPTYSMLPKNIQALRRFPLAGTFVSFPYEVFRTTKNNVEYLIEDIRETATDKDGKILPMKDWNSNRAKMAIKQATGMALANGLAFGLSEFTMNMLDIDDEEDDTMRNMSAPWQKDSSFIYFGYDKGRPIFLDATSMFPSETIFKSVRTLFEERKGRSTEEKISRSLLGVGQSFLGMDVSFQGMTNLLMNKDNFDQQLYKGENLIEGILEDPEAVTNYILKQMGPGIYNNIAEFARANDINPDYFGDKITNYGREYTNQDALLGLFGMRFTTMNYGSGMMSLGYEIKDDIGFSKKKVNKKLKSTRELSSEEIKSIVKDYQEDHELFSEKSKGMVAGAIKLKIKKDKIFKALKIAGYSGGDIARLLGNDSPMMMPIGDATISGQIDKLDVTLDFDKELKKDKQSTTIKNMVKFNKELLKANSKMLKED